ncbi:MAG: hypothetical protein QM730_02500 [Anaerolineales bacterium]
MKNKSRKTKKLVTSIFILVGMAILGRLLLLRCPEPSYPFQIQKPFYIGYLYPWPDAKIPFACHTAAFLKSPFAPQIFYSEDVFREDGIPILGGKSQYRPREGAFIAAIPVVYELYYQFPEPVKLGETPRLVDAASFYMDEKKLKIGHIGWREDNSSFYFTTIFDPFLWPGEHTGKITIQLPSGEILEYKWNFEITWW